MIRALRDDDPGVISAALTALGRDKPMSQYEKYLAEQRAGVRRVLVATQPGPDPGSWTRRIQQLLG